MATYRLVFVICAEALPVESRECVKYVLWSEREEIGPRKDD